MDIVRHAQEGSEDLVIGREVALVATRKELKQAAALIALATDAKRELIEGPVDGVLYSDTGGKDHLHYRRGMLDDAAAKILGRDGKALVIGLSELINAKDFSRALGRAVQDARLAAKRGAPVVFVSLADEFAPTTHDLEAAMRAFGMPEELTRKNQKVLAAWAGKARHRASDEYIAEGVSKAKGI